MTTLIGTVTTTRRRQAAAQLVQSVVHDRYDHAGGSDDGT